MANSAKKLPQKCTAKKLKVVGTQPYINATTGEMVDMAVTEIEERDFNFSKVWMRNFISTMELVGNKKTKLSFWIIDHLDKENKLCLSYRQIADETNLSLDTVSTTMKALLDADFIRKVGTAYQVNPDVVFKGTHNARAAILSDYYAAPKPVLSDADKIRLLKDSIAALQRQLDSLTPVVVDAQLEGQLSLIETDTHELVIGEKATMSSAKKKGGK